MTDHLDITALSAYLDGELDAGQTIRIDHHLADCAQCRALFVELQTLSLNLQALSIEPPPIDLSPRLERLLHSRQPHNRVRLGWRKHVPMTLGTAASLMLGIFLGSALQPPQLDAKTPETSILAVLGSAPPGALCARPELCYLQVNLP